MGFNREAFEMIYWYFWNRERVVVYEKMYEKLTGMYLAGNILPEDYTRIRGEMNDRMTPFQRVLWRSRQERGSIGSRMVSMVRRLFGKAW